MPEPRLTPPINDDLAEAQETFGRPLKPDADTLGARMKRLRMDAGKNQTEIAEMLGVKQASVARYERNDSRPSDDILDHYAQLMGTTAAWIAFGVGEPKKNTVPIIGFVGAGNAVFPLEVEPDLSEYDFIEIPFVTEEGAAALRVKGDSNYPEMADGDVLVYKWDSSFDEADCLRKRCIIHTIDGRILVKRLQKGSQFGHYDLESTNAPLMKDVEIHWASPVIGIVFR